MQLNSIIEILNNKFKVAGIPPDLPFNNLLPRKYDEAGIEFKKYFTEEFLKNFHGLMIKNGEEITKIYLTVFLSEEILDKIFRNNEQDILIFSHHPMFLETNNRGFLPLKEKYFLEMKERRVSVYSLHSPLDINEEISTSKSIANKLSLKNLKVCAPWQGSFSGVYGELPKAINFEDFIKSLNVIFGIKECHFIKKHIDVFRVGIIAGGGTDIKDIKEIISLGRDTYLTGDFVNKVKNEYGEAERKKFESIKNSLNINLIECSHYATEKLVILNEITKLFKDRGFNTLFIKQDNPWG
ncbi:hypothetical protein COT27_00960 [Candidatus Kuenenbacteria bacterium CG08_land_8_20_14_0_20_37_23]|uniref:Nif3-like dinuclear metal center hexameric protein n=1 Tax=Candidatus Kuenenbacteria bacterium CG08_land_8_20_14_0_20_37_23 TaxID=1974617 RepID=A0A2M6XTF1_9BACT|nr:MAG: hypothetical protein COT27_00960 [Candidatus Kuenenbacteria bacterium CG08_land_8_20_14_0_20_37_23]